jgi:uncharacterized protein (DUF885 family)
MKSQLNARMEKVKKNSGLKDFIGIFEYVRTKTIYKTRGVIANFERIYIIKPNVDKLFSLQPRDKFEIRRTEAFREKCNKVQS